MNNTVLTNQRKQPSVWLLIIIALSALALFSYEKLSIPTPQENQPELLAEQEVVLLQNDAINMGWLRTLNPLVKKVEGRLVWSNSLQKGVMEFFGLPKINDNQMYQLWIYDLTEDSSKPLFATEFNKVNANLMLVPFTAEKRVISPFKFELVLTTEGQATSQPLFLAQP